MEQIDLKVRGGGPLRCAYCHDSVPAEERSACADCLAVHHDACWREAGVCASCQGSRPLLAPGVPAPPAPPPRITAARPAVRPPVAETPQAAAQRSRREFAVGCMLVIAIGLAVGGGLTAMAAFETFGGPTWIALAEALGLFVASGFVIRRIWKMS